MKESEMLLSKIEESLRSFTEGTRLTIADFLQSSAEKININGPDAIKGFSLAIGAMCVCYVDAVIVEAERAKRKS